jgi:GMP synthase (glutamine-hydrolysing)
VIKGVNPVRNRYEIGTGAKTYDRSMRVLVIQHDDDKPLGRLEAPLRAAGLALDVRLAGHDPVALGDHVAVVALSGFANPVDESEAVVSTRATLGTALDRNLPTLGVCLGAQLLAQAGGAPAGRCEAEYGYATVQLTTSAQKDRLFHGLPAEIEVFHAHDYAVSLPEGATALAHTANALQAFRLGPLAWGIQFHPEPSVAIVDAWVASHQDFLRSRGASPEGVAADARRLDQDAADLATRIAGGFARLVLDRSTS